MTNQMQGQHVKFIACAVFLGGALFYRRSQNEYPRVGLSVDGR